MKEEHQARLDELIDRVVAELVSGKLTVEEGKKRFTPVYQEGTVLVTTDLIKEHHRLDRKLEIAYGRGRK